MISTLRTYLEEISAETIRVKKEVDPLTQLGTLCSQSEQPLIFENIKGYPGWKVCDRLIGTRKLQAIALHTTPERVLPEAAKRIARGAGELRMVKDGPVKEKIFKGSEVDLFRLPVAVHSHGDGGRYIGAGMCVTKDPDTGVQNEGIYRTQVKEGNRAAFMMGRRRGWAHFTQYERQGEAMPMAIVLGHHPAYELACAYNGPRGDYDEFALGASLLEEPLELIPCETIDLKVPAHAEIVIEGVTLPKVREPEGPFGEFTGLMGPGTMAPILEVTAVTLRGDALYRHINASRVTDHQVLTSLINEIELYNNLRRVYGHTEILDVHIPPWARLTAFVQMVPVHEGHAKAVLLAAMGLNMHQKEVIVVDDDVDIHDPKDVFWALSYRVNPARDIITVAGMRGHHLDLSCLESGRGEEGPHRINGALGIDATKPPLVKPAERERFARVKPMGEGQVFLKDLL